MSENKNENRRDNRLISHVQLGRGAVSDGAIARKHRESKPYHWANQTAGCLSNPTTEHHIVQTGVHATLTVNKVKCGKWKEEKK